jgi:hypothetical protein
MELRGRGRFACEVQSADRESVTYRLDDFRNLGWWMSIRLTEADLRDALDRIAAERMSDTQEVQILQGVQL